MIHTRYVVHRTRRVRDLLRRQKFVAAQRFPGGREIRLGSGETRQRAVLVARNAARPNGSPTAGGTFVAGFEPGSLGNGGRFQTDISVDIT